jgi:hypothetical protein
MARDYSKPSEAANLRIAGATRLHCDNRPAWMGPVDEYDSGISERDGARGKANESQEKRFNAELRRGTE